MRRTLAAAVGALTTACACAVLATPAGRFFCATDADCPPGQGCATDNHCGTPGAPLGDGGTLGVGSPDGSTSDAGDGGRSDGGGQDGGGQLDGGAQDGGGQLDGGEPDGGAQDGGPQDSGPTDAGCQDALCPWGEVCGADGGCVQETLDGLTITTPLALWVTTADGGDVGGPWSPDDGGSLNACETLNGSYTLMNDTSAQITLNNFGVSFRPLGGGPGSADLLPVDGGNTFDASYDFTVKVDWRFNSQLPPGQWRAYVAVQPTGGGPLVDSARDFVFTLAALPDGGC